MPARPEGRPPLAAPSAGSARPPAAAPLPSLAAGVRVAPTVATRDPMATDPFDLRQRDEVGSR
jgi:hypothetical protein